MAVIGLCWDDFRGVVINLAPPTVTTESSRAEVIVTSAL